MPTSRTGPSPDTRRLQNQCVAQSLRQSARHRRPPAPGACDPALFFGCSPGSRGPAGFRPGGSPSVRVVFYPCKSGNDLAGASAPCTAPRRSASRRRCPPPPGDVVVRQQRRPDVVRCHPMPRCPARRIPRAHDRAGDGPACWHGGREVADEFGAILVLVVSDSLPPPGLSKHSPGMHEPGALPPGQIERACCTRASVRRAPAGRANEQSAQRPACGPVVTTDPTASVASPDDCRQPRRALRGS